MKRIEYILIFLGTRNASIWMCFLTIIFGLFNSENLWTLSTANREMFIIRRFQVKKKKLQITFRWWQNF